MNKYNNSNNNSNNSNSSRLIDNMKYKIEYKNNSKSNINLR